MQISQFQPTCDDSIQLFMNYVFGDPGQSVDSFDDAEFWDEHQVRRCPQPQENALAATGRTPHPLVPNSGDRSRQNPLAEDFAGLEHVRKSDETKKSCGVLPGSVATQTRTGAQRVSIEKSNLGEPHPLQFDSEFCSNAVGYSAPGIFRASQFRCEWESCGYYVEENGVELKGRWGADGLGGKLWKQSYTGKKVTRKNLDEIMNWLPFSNDPRREFQRRVRRHILYHVAFVCNAVKIAAGTIESSGTDSRALPSTILENSTFSSASESSTPPADTISLSSKQDIAGVHVYCRLPNCKMKKPFFKETNTLSKAVDRHIKTHLQDWVCYCSRCKKGPFSRIDGHLKKCPARASKRKNVRMADHDEAFTGVLDEVPSQNDITPCASGVIYEHDGTLGNKVNGKKRAAIGPDSVDSSETTGCIRLAKKQRTSNEF